MSGEVVTSSELSLARTPGWRLRTWAIAFGFLSQTVTTSQPPSRETGDAGPRVFAEFRQHGSGDATLAIPADEVALAEAPPQAAEQRCGERGVDASARPGLTLEIDQDQQERTTRAGGTL